MKIVLLAATPPPIGGIATWTLRMLNIDPAYNCQYLLVDEKMIDGRDMFGHNKKSIMTEIKRCINIWKELVVKLRKEDPDIVQSCIPASTLSMMREFICACIAKTYKKKFVVHFHCTVPNAKDGKLWLPMLKVLSKMCDCVFVLNEQSRQYMENTVNARIEVFPNFVEQHEIAESHVIKEKIRNVLYVGGVIKSKGVLDIFDVAKLQPEITFRFVGNSDAAVEAEAKGIPNVVLTGPKTKEEVREEMDSSDVFMFLSKFPGEGFSVALLEAMSRGVPCIVTNWAANREMIGNEGGVTIEEFSDGLVSSIIDDMQSVEKRQSYSMHNIDTVKRNYSSEALFGRYVTVYSEIIDEQ